MGHSPWSYKESDMTEATKHTRTIAMPYKLLGRGGCWSVLVPSYPCLPPVVPVYLCFHLYLCSRYQKPSPYLDIFGVLKGNIHTENAQVMRVQLRAFS